MRKKWVANMIGTTLAGRYEVQEELGAGATGRVYRALDHRTGSVVAVKVLHPQAARDRSAVLRVRTEAQVAASINSTRVVAIRETGEQAGQPFLVMEFIDGPTLAEALQQRGRFSVDDALEVVLEAARALQAAHERGIIHRDLKPANIKLSSAGVKVLDFGLARTLAGAQSAGMLPAGSAQYAAPEQGDGRPDIRSDIYSLGCILFALLTGSPPFDGSLPGLIAAAHKTQPLPPLPPEIPGPVRIIVHQCLAKRPLERYQSPAQLVSAIMAAQAAIAAERERAALAAAAPPEPPAPVLVDPGTMVIEQDRAPVQPATVASPPAAIIEDDDNAITVEPLRVEPAESEKRDLTTEQPVQSARQHEAAAAGRAVSAGEADAVPDGGAPVVSRQASGAETPAVSMEEPAPLAATSAQAPAATQNAGGERDGAAPAPTTPPLSDSARRTADEELARLARELGLPEPKAPAGPPLPGAAGTAAEAAAHGPFTPPPTPEPGVLVPTDIAGVLPAEPLPATAEPSAAAKTVPTLPAPSPAVPMSAAPPSQEPQQGSGFPSPAAPPARIVTNLPAPTTPVNAADAGQAAPVLAALSAGRVVTILAERSPAKTRLAVACARTALASFPDGVWFVELAAVTDASVVAEVIVSALQLTADPLLTPAESLAGFLASGLHLLVLDNCEQLSEAVGPLMFTLLRLCPNLHLLTTSTQPLGLPGEQLLT